jgi:hypothetical protein
MAETIIAKIRVKETYFADPITDATGISTAEWELQPLTFRDDELVISEEDPEEEELYSHENDSPESYDITGKGLTISGSFIKATRAQMVDLLGGQITGVDPNQKFNHSASKQTLNKAIKFVCQDGSEVIAPNASGYVNLNLNIGKSGVGKFPFKFRLKKASATWDCDLII